MAATRIATRVLPVAGMDCPEEALAIERALERLPGVQQVTVLPSAARLTVAFDPGAVSLAEIEAAIATTGCAVGEARAATRDGEHRDIAGVFSWSVIAIVAAVVLVAAIGERTGMFEAALDWLPWWLAAGAIVLGGWPVLVGVARAALNRRITSHTLMTSGAVVAAAAGEWSAAALIVFFMRFGEWIEGLTIQRSRRALAELLALRPNTAHVLRNGAELELPADTVRPGDVVVVRPGERIPVDGEVIDGQAPVNEAPVTGESLPVEKAPGDGVFAASIVEAGHLKLRATLTAADTTFARIVRLVEEAEGHKAPVQRLADRFATYYLPVVLGLGLGTWVVSGEVLRGVAVILVACACAITLATPVVVLASVGHGARRGLLVKGGVALEELARVDTVVFDKTGTVTRGRPEVTDVIPVDGMPAEVLVQAAASVEAWSEHPLARAIVRHAARQRLGLADLERFRTITGRGVVGELGGVDWAVGSRGLLDALGVEVGRLASRAEQLEAEGKTTFFVVRADQVVGVIGLADELRPEVSVAVRHLRSLGIHRLVLFTGDNERVAAAVAQALDIEFRSGLLPADKIAGLRRLQTEGHVVMMVGDGVNDAPALAQANVGVAMAAGTAVAIEAADVALMRDDWTMVPEAIRLGRRAARTIRQNLAFTALYNIVGIGLAAAGVLPPVWAAAAQVLPDVAIMLNASRLLRHGRSETHPARSVSAEPVPAS